MKWLKRIVIVAVVLLVVGVVAVWLGANYAAKKGVEVGGTAALGVETGVRSVSIGWLSSSVGINGLKVASPPGYQTDRLLSLGDGKVACSVSSLLGDEVEVKEIVLDQPELTIEVKAGIPPKSNLGDLLASLKSVEAAPEPQKAAAQKRFKVGLIRITKTKVRFHLIGGKTADLVLPTIELKDVKNADGTPLMLADIFRQVLASMAVSVGKSAGGIVPDDLLKGLGDTAAMAQQFLDKGFKGIGSEVGKGLGTVTKGAGDLGKGVGDIGKGATKGVGDALSGILGKKKTK